MTPAAKPWSSPCHRARRPSPPSRPAHPSRGGASAPCEITLRRGFAARGLAGARTIGALSLILVAIGLGAAACEGAATVADLCENECDCNAGARAAACVPACKQEYAAKQTQAKEQGCHGPFADWLDCMSSAACISGLGALDETSCAQEQEALTTCTARGGTVAVVVGAGAGGRSSESGGAGGHGGHGAGNGAGSTGSGTDSKQATCEAVAAKLVHCCPSGEANCQPDTESDWVTWCLQSWDFCPQSFKCQAQTSGCDTSQCPDVGNGGC